MSDTPKITYTPSRGLAEVSRLIFAVNDVQVEEEYLITKAAFENLRATGKLTFQQIPLVEIDGLCLVESSAQANYLGHKYNMLGRTDHERGRVQVLFAGAQSLFLHGGFLWIILSEPEKKEEDMKAAIEKAKSRYLPAFEKAFAENGTGFLVGSSPTIADCSFFSIAAHYEEMSEFGDLIEGFPHCKAFLMKFAEIPGVKKYLNSPRRFPPLTDDELIAKIRAAILFK